MPAYEVLRKVLVTSGLWCVPIVVFGAMHMVSIIHRRLRPLRTRTLYATLGMTLIIQPWLLGSEANALFGQHPAMCTEFFVLYTVMFALGPTITFGAVLMLSAVFEAVARVMRSRTTTKQAGARTASTP